MFGSRVTGTSRRYSDLDLALKGEEPLNLDMLNRLKDGLSDSDLTVKVDLVDLRAADPAFRRIIERDMVFLPSCTGSTRSINIAVYLFAPGRGVL